VAPTDPSGPTGAREGRWLASLAFVAVAAAVGSVLLPGRTSSRPNVVLVSIDTLRADHLGCYGYGPPTSPRIDAFAADAVVFDEAISAAPSTLAAHASILTSLIVPHHGASYRLKRPLPPSRATLAEILRDDGYATRSWNGGGQLDPAFGLGRGFDEYRSVQVAAAGQAPPREPSDADHLRSAVRRALGWLDETTDSRPFFLFLHSYETHHPYTPDPALRALFGRFPTRLGETVSIDDLRRFNRGEWPLEPGDLAHIIASYDAEIRSADRAFGDLMDGLRARGLDKSTLVVLTSDHGEEFGEHGRVGWHSHTLFDELLRVPLVVRLPGGALAGTRVGAQVRGIDIAPTILDWTGIRPPATFEGRSLRDTLGGSPGPSRPALSTYDGGRGVAMREGGWKWIRNQGLYDLRRDPIEQNPLRGHGRKARRRPSDLRHRADLRRRAVEWLASRPPTSPPSTAIDIDDELEERLEALGYVTDP